MIKKTRKGNANIVGMAKVAKRSKAAKVKSVVRVKAVELAVKIPSPPKPAVPEVKITAAKGRPMLTWVGKRPLARLTAFPAQRVEVFDPARDLSRLPEAPERWKQWPAQYSKGGLLFHGDNKEVMAHLLANGFRGMIDLIYIDPPFDSGADYIRKVTLRGSKSKLDGETYTLGEQLQYSDIWTRDTYLQFMYERLLLLRELLSDKGSIVLHCDCTRAHFLRCIMEEVFGSEKFFKNEIIWFYRRWPTNTPAFQSMHDNLYWFSKCNDNAHTFNKPYEQASERTLSDYGGKRLTTVETENGSFIKRQTDEESQGVAMRDVWEISREHPRGNEHTDYPTQKPTQLLERIIDALSSPGDVVLDAFVGSGTTAVVAQRMGRRWIGCDINKGGIQTTVKRLQSVITEQIASKQQRVLLEAVENSPSLEPVQRNFTVFRVNDYDLAIRQDEAVTLACEHIGVERIRTDSYFDGKLGEAWVKIIPLGHPLSLADLDELRRELDARMDDPKAITLVCLGMEIGAVAWIEEWNKYRKGKDAINRISVIELRTDPKYGRFIEHRPAQSKVTISRQKNKIRIEIEDFISPTIIERLQQQAGVLKPKVDDWRAMVDCVSIDTAFNGEVFNVVLTDVPERKTDFVTGTYELDAPNGSTTVAVKIIDMLGEEVITTQSV